MKRFWLVLLSLGLIVAFSTSAMAVDVKFSGSYYVAGLYLDKTSLVKDVSPSTAFYFQRLRLKTDLVVSPGLTLTSQADIMERAWGATRSTAGTALDTLSEGTRAENENIAFDLLYLTYVSPIGAIMAGYQYDGLWGTDFANQAVIAGKIAYVLQKGGLRAIIQMGKNNDGEKSSGTFGGAVTNASDRDSSFYTAAVIYSWKDGAAGFLFKYIRNAANRNAFGALVPNTGFTQNVYIATPYAKAKIGPVALQAEVLYVFGKAAAWEGNPSLIGQQDVTVGQLLGWIDATADFGRFYVGGSLAYSGGDDPGTTDKMEGGVINGGTEWNPCLLMFNNDLTYWAGSLAGHTGTTANAGPMTNAYFAQLRAGVRPVDKLDIMASVSWAKAQYTPQAVWLSREYGYEVDLTATYKITNNLSYMLGAGYLFTGDYYKGANSANEVSNNFLVISKLALTF